MGFLGDERVQYAVGCAWGQDPEKRRRAMKQHVSGGLQAGKTGTLTVSWEETRRGREAGPRYRSSKSIANRLP